MLTADFEYHLPPERIAQRSVEPRDQSRLLVVDRATGERHDRHFYDLPSLLRPGDLIVLNDTKVFRARLHGSVNGHPVELFLLRPITSPKTEDANMDGRQFSHPSFWEALTRPGRKIHNGSRIEIATEVGCEKWTVVQKSHHGIVTVASPYNEQGTLDFANRIGAIPVPPYIHTLPERDEQYQTIYAQRTGSVAAPTSGFHFTEGLMNELKAGGINFATVTLHVGLGTFRPIKTDRIEDHIMHAEWAEVPQATVDAINETKRRGGRVIAVGTTTTRTLEGIVALHGKLIATSEDISLFITPGFHFQVIDGLITNFHLPRTTLLSLVAAFLGRRDALMACYRHALDHDYRFASFGDAMLIV